MSDSPEDHSDGPPDDAERDASGESAVEKTPEQLIADAQAEKAKLVAMGIAVLSVVIICVWCVVGSLSGGDEDSDSSAMAEIMCEEFVADRLKAPSTADFSGASTVAVGASTYKVTGAVDAENGFGAMIRVQYVCQVRYDGDDLWTAEYVRLLE
ncbi:hypothetical protein AB0I28_02740 [Phytomonospora sp. NPDC050363]|uniref:hypothetical protein n=1 Tax=Phytomonospora sp. NPDC050363 TaxID=3155642 RepID=UPI0033C321D6